MLHQIGRPISSYIDNNCEVENFCSHAQEWLDSGNYEQIITLGTAILKRDCPLDVKAMVCGFLCQMYDRKKDSLNTMHYGKEFCKLSAHMKDDKFTFFVLCSYADSLLKNKCEKEAFEILQIVEPNSNKFADSEELNFIYITYAVLLEKQPNSDILKVIELYEKGHAHSNSDDDTLYLANLYLRGKKYEKCRQLRNVLFSMITSLNRNQVAQLTSLTAQLTLWENYSYWTGK